MEKLIAESILRRGVINKIEDHALLYPLELELNKYKKSKCPRIYNAILTFEFDQKMRKEWEKEYLASIRVKKIRAKVEKAIKNSTEKKKYGRLAGIWTQKRNSAIQAMIIDSAWSSELADHYDISKKDVRHHFSVHMGMKAYLNFEVDNRFKDELFKRALKAYKIEDDKVKKYKELLAPKNSKGLLRSLLETETLKRENPIPPRFMIEEELYGKGKDGRSSAAVLSDQLNSYYTSNFDEERVFFHAGRQISQHTYKKEKERIRRKLRQVQKRNQKLREWLFLDNEANLNMTYIKAVGRWKLEDYINHEKDVASIPVLNGVDPMASVF